MTKEERAELIEAYRQNRLSDVQRRQVEQWLQEDPSFRKAVEQEHALWEALGPSGVNCFRQVVGEVVAERRGPSSAGFLRRYWPVLAAAVTLAVIGLWWIFRPGQPIEEQLFAQYFEAPAVLGITRGDDPIPAPDGPARLQQEVDSMYRRGDYRQALSRLEEMGIDSPQLRSSDFYYRAGILYLLTDQPGRALEALQSIQTGYPNEKPWYIAWAYLQLGDRKKAVEAFTTIAQSDSPFSLDASAVAKALGPFQADRPVQ